jgi:hypothetical protein
MDLLSVMFPNTSSRIEVIDLAAYALVGAIATYAFLSIRNRKTRPHPTLIRIANLVFATFFACVAIEHFTPPRFGGHWDAQAFSIDAIVFTWFLGAIGLGLFFYQRFAWVCSMIGASALLCVCGRFAFGGIAFIFADTHDLTEPAVYSFMLTIVCLALLVCSSLFIGLLKLRKDVFQDGADAA